MTKGPRRLRQAVNHPLLVMSKASAGGDENTDDILSSNGTDDADIKRLIADFANGRESESACPPGDEDVTVSSQTLQRLEKGETRMCLFCQEEVEAEVILPCYHIG
jgi:DNA repair protein RAD5